MKRRQTIAHRLAFLTEYGTLLISAPGKETQINHNWSCLRDESIDLMHLIDLDLLIFVHEIPQVAWLIKLIQSIASIVETLQRSDINVLHIIKVEQFFGLFRISAIVDCAHILDAMFDYLTGQDRALLLLMPIPTNDSWQPRVN